MVSTNLLQRFQGRTQTHFFALYASKKPMKISLLTLPNSTRFFDYIRKRATYGDRNFQEINRRIGDSTEETLLSQVATWHRSCYQDTCHPNMCKRAKERYEKQLAQKVKSPTAPGPSTSAPTFTRSHSNPYDSTLCFFCEEKSGRGNPLFTIRTDKAGWHLHSAIEKSNNDKFRVKLSTAVNPKDAHAIDIQYHNKCWTAHVTNVIRKQTTEGSEHNAVDEVAADIEFISLVEEIMAIFLVCLIYRKRT